MVLGYVLAILIVIFCCGLFSPKDKRGREDGRPLPRERGREDKRGRLGDPGDRRPLPPERAREDERGRLEINGYAVSVNILDWGTALAFVRIGISFDKVTELVVDECVSSTNLVIPSGVLTSLIKLNSLTVSNCQSVEVIFDLEGMNVDKLTAIPLRELKLINLPKLKYICPASTNRLKIESSGVEVIVAEDQTLLSTIRFVFPCLEKLVLKKLANLKNFYPRRHTIECPKLSYIEIMQCKKVKVFNWEVSKRTEKEADGGVEIKYPFFLSEKVVPQLSHLSLNQNDVEQMLDRQFKDKFFRSVEHLLLDSSKAQELSYFLYTFLKKFSGLSSLTISHSSIKVIFPHQQPSSDSPRKVSLIRSLELTHLDQLESIWNGHSQTYALLQSLKQLDVNHCSKLMNLAPSSASFDNLTKLIVSNCHGLRYLLTATTTRSLVKLTTLKIKGCKRMEEIVASEDETVEGIELVNLKDVELVDLPLLRRYPFKSPLLKNVTVTGCPKICQGDSTSEVRDSGREK